MKICPSCARENAEDARFCSACGSPLEVEAAREERKVVTCLFCDLVGFTARAERMDPEDVRRLLQPYHARLRTELERFGGTVEKFIGDAVMAVFGAPVAHEDDPERAVRAALAIRDELGEDGALEVRIGITTGEALVALGARPSAGEGMASGDVVNTAARLQAAAPVNGILVDETTYRATERTIEYGEARSIDAKGKAEPVAVWEAQRARSRVSVERVGGAPLVGREQELTLLRETLARVIGERESQLVTLVGVPGIGKSRLVYELFQTVETEEHGLVYWRHGRSLPYGEGVTFWALGEMVRAQAGILESDGPGQAEAKLRETIETFVQDPSDAAWIEGRLRPLAGLEADERSEDRRGQAFAAWRRFLEAIADVRPLILVFEDLHWADDALLDFVDYLVDWVSGVPLLVLCTARPELLVRRPDWGGGKVNSSTLLLSPLSDEQTATLLHTLLGRSALDASLQARLLEHAGGNPLYAEEFTRMLTARPGAVVLPETVQGIIAARLDTLPADEKELLQDAAVIGRVFWLGALGRERWTLEEQLHSLARKEFVTRNRRSSVAGEDEYAFRHALVREVAYEQIPRAQRADKHLAAAQWIESLGRAEHHAELLAHHYLAALQFAEAAREPTEALALRARHALREAGDRALGLNAFASAERFYASALELWPDDDPERGLLLLSYGRAQSFASAGTGEEALTAARDALVEVGDADSAAVAEIVLADVCRMRAEGERSREHRNAALSLVDGRPSSPASARVLAYAARHLMLYEEYEEAIRIGKDAVAVAEALDLGELRAAALNAVGTSRMITGDARGREDLERSIEIALELSSIESVRAFNNLGATLVTLGDLREAGAMWDRGREVGNRLGDAAISRFLELNLINQSFWSGHWDDALERAEGLIARWEEGSPHVIAIWAYDVRGRIRLAREDTDGASNDAVRSLTIARSADEPSPLKSSLAFGAVAALAAGRRNEAAALADELLAHHPGRRPPQRFTVIFDLAVALCELGRQQAVLDEAALAKVRTLWLEAAEAYARDEFTRAADVYERSGALPFEAYARLRAAEKLVAEGSAPRAEEQLQRSLAFWRSVGATRHIREAEELLGDLSEVSA